MDPGLDLDPFLAEINKYNIKGILLTHCHLDHIDGIGHFNCPVYIHESDYEGLTDKNLSLYNMSRKTPSYNINSLSIVKVKDNDEIAFNKNTIKVISTPGHTKGSVCYLYKDKLFTGDTLFKQSIGRSDFPSGNEKQLANSLIKIIDSLDGTIKVYPGHDEPTTIKDEKKNNMYYYRAKRK